VRRLKDCLKTSAAGGEGLSRCTIWKMPDDGILSPDIEATVRFRIREETDAHYFRGHDTIDADTVGYLSRLAQHRVTDLPLYLAMSRKYGLLRQFHTRGLRDISPLIQAERDILYRYCGTYATANMLAEALVECKGVRATFVDDRPGIMALCDMLPPAGGEARFLWRRYGEIGVFAVVVEGGGTGYATAFVINTPCLDDILSDGRLHLAFSDGSGKVCFVCKEGIL
jgi:hypothetical protein